MIFKKYLFFVGMIFVSSLFGHDYVQAFQRELFFDEILYFVSISPDLARFKKKVIDRWLLHYKKEILLVFEQVSDDELLEGLVKNIDTSLHKLSIHKNVKVVFEHVIAFVLKYRRELSLVLQRLRESHILDSDDAPITRSGEINKAMIEQYKKKKRLQIYHYFAADFFILLARFDKELSGKLWKYFIFL